MYTVSGQVDTNYFPYERTFNKNKNSRQGIPYES